MSSIRLQQNAIILAAAQRFVSYGSEAAQLLVNGKETKHITKKGVKLLTLFKAYKKNSDLDTPEVDSLLYCLRLLSGQDSFPTQNPIVGQSLNVQILVAGGNIIFYNQGVLLGGASEVDFEAILASLNGNRLTVTLPDGIVINIGDWDASANTFPISGGTGIGGAIKKGNEVDVIVAGAPGGYPVNPGAILRAKVDSPGQILANWRIFD